ncbi:hypothetical protein HN385_00835 [archaeon]|jgi:hypothetical protein|nr:hypothetical protein [archaeon]MBT3451269.1 hypothetical protein [archaeon]MBT6869552.1 hypothetical protein [archaeon]MBT7193456.1 hypothetical protein [archaeon]MBT7381047.1 hypothetical protein [archaeon]
MKLTDILNSKGLAMNMLKSYAAIGIMVGLTIGTYQCCKHPLENQNYAVPENYSYNHYPVNQVFRDHDGYRIIFDDENGRVQEIEFQDNNHITYHHWGYIYPNVPEDNHFSDLSNLEGYIKIFHDLEIEEEGYADAIIYKLPQSVLDGVQRDYNYVEIHLPLDQELNPGLERWGHHPQHMIEGTMKEVK